VTKFHVPANEGERADLGVATMRQVVPSAATEGSFAVAEFIGTSGAWTVPHIHAEMEESFYVTEGTFTFTCGEERIEASPGSFILIPRGTPHMIEAGPEGGALLTLFVPGGLEEMFLELGRLPAGALTDPATRADIGRRYDSKPV
jgi:quercetin dioxygenase-like cupin family protein